MPRIRTVKPEFWADEKLAPLDPITRLVFLGLISMADDAGRLVDSLKQIDAFIFPHTEDTAREPLANLSRMGRVRRGQTASGQRIIQIVNWKHQKVDHPNLSAALPPIAKEVSPPLAKASRKPRDPLATLSVPVPTISTSTIADSDESGPKDKRRSSELLTFEQCEALRQKWESIGRSCEYPRFRKALKPLFVPVQRFTPEQLGKAIEAFDELARADGPSKGSLWHLQRFVDHIGTYVEWGAMPGTDEKGLPTARGKAAMGIK